MFFAYELKVLFSSNNYTNDLVSFFVLTKELLEKRCTNFSATKGS